MTDHPGEARAWADNHTAFSRSASHLVHRVMGAFDALHRARYDAPWSPRTIRRAR